MKGEIFRNGFVKIEDKYDKNGKIIPWFKLKKEIRFLEEDKTYAIDAEFEVKE